MRNTLCLSGGSIILRVDAGVALPEILQVCERSGVGYVIDFARNAVTERKMSDFLERARLQFFKTKRMQMLLERGMQ